VADPASAAGVSQRAEPSPSTQTVPAGHSIPSVSPPSAVQCAIVPSGKQVSRSEGAVSADATQNADTHRGSTAPAVDTVEQYAANAPQSPALTTEPPKHRAM